MEREIFISRFEEYVEELKEKYGVNIWLVEVLGKRYAYIAGHREDIFLPPKKIYLNERFVLFSNQWEMIPEMERERLLKVLKEDILR
ncbi:MAG: hypothetical protein PWR24_1619 [Desulfonauticus sp.]|jgi:hypothetical protein|nr:hypothetical protein [Desulfonauticus sp.]